MNYPAILTYEGARVLAAFPDCPGCQTFAEAGEDILRVAQEALEGWLEVALRDGEAPSKPSVAVAAPASGTMVAVPVGRSLAEALTRRWRTAAEGSDDPNQG